MFKELRSLNNMRELTANHFIKMVESGKNELANNYQEIDQLNVFPVPDGDTGTNMNLTFSNGYAEIKNLKSDHIGEVSKILSRGLLMGARGNSGVILSQIFRGFSKAIEDKKTINSQDLANAFDSGREVAYKAVMRPVEGTILTVMRYASENTLKYVASNPDTNFIETMDYFVSEGYKALEKTPEMLPILKEVGVVDSGGAGLMAILEGFKSYLHDEPVELLTTESVSHDAVQTSIEHDEFGYCTEFIIKLNDHMTENFNEQRFSKDIEKIGDSLVVVHDEDLVKVHIHTLKPGDALNFGQRFGEFVKLKIENMTEQHEAILVEQANAYHENPPVKHQKYALITVAAGAGLTNHFKALRVDKIIEGGQTMNPSTEDFVAALNSINANHIIILPNNSNILLAAKQTAEVLDDKDITVLESKSIPQGISACIGFNPEASLEENIENMTEAMENTRSGQITYAIKDTSYESMEIKEGEYMALSGKTIVTSTNDKDESLRALLKSMIDEDSEIITLIVGDDVTEEHGQNLADEFEEEFDLDVELVVGNQPIYSYIVGVE